jgi:hypothetical protein
MELRAEGVTTGNSKVMVVKPNLSSERRFVLVVDTLYNFRLRILIDKCRLTRGSFYNVFCVIGQDHKEDRVEDGVQRV